MHALRHLYTSERIEAGMSTRSLADRLGHPDPASTLRDYVDARDQVGRILADSSFAHEGPVDQYG